jgi:hypothetical protein
MVAMVATVVRGAAIKVAATKMAKWLLTNVVTVALGVLKLNPSFQSTALYFADIGAVTELLLACFPEMVPTNATTSF